MTEQHARTGNGQRFADFVERMGRRIPDPIIIFMAFYPIAFLVTVVMGGSSFESMGAAGEPVTYTILSMADGEHIRWIFDNALLNNWLAFGNGVLAVILIAVLAVGVAERSGLFGALIKQAAGHIPHKLLPVLLMFLGIMSSIATDAGYLILIPLAGLLYAGLGRNPIIGMAVAFAGVSAGFSANLIPGTPVDVIIGMNAQAFAAAQGVPFTTADGTTLQAATMNYYFIVVSTVVLTAVGAWVTWRWVEPRLDRQPFEIPEELDGGEFTVTAQEKRGLLWAAAGATVSLLMIAGFILGPLKGYTMPDGTIVRPYMTNIILLVCLFFIVTGVFYGVATAHFRSVTDVMQAMVAQMNTMGYILVLTFFSYNFLGLLTYSGLGTWITYIGAQFLLALHLDSFPVLLLVGFVLVTAFINLIIGGLTSKWMLLGPIFVPMLYFVNPAMTPDVVAAAYRVADSATNIITPMMIYAGVILAFMRKYRPGLAFGDMLLIMLPYSIVFLLVWTTLLVLFFAIGIPLGF